MVLSAERRVQRVNSKRKKGYWLFVIGYQEKCKDQEASAFAKQSKLWRDKWGKGQSAGPVISYQGQSEEPFFDKPRIKRTHGARTAPPFGLQGKGLGARSIAQGVVWRKNWEYIV